MLYQVTQPREKSLIWPTMEITDTCSHWLDKVKAYESIGCLVRVSKFNGNSVSYTPIYSTPDSRR